MGSMATEAPNESEGAAEAAASSAPHSECVAALMELGFSEAAVTKALLINGHHMELATDWLLNHPEEQGEPEQVAASTELHVEVISGEEVVSEDVLTESSPIVLAIRDNIETQRDLENPKVLEAFQKMVNDPSTAHQYLADPVIGPALMRLHDIAMVQEVGRV